MNHKTDSSVPSTRFPATRWSAILATTSADVAERTRGLEILILAYWQPVYKFIRLKWHKSSEDAKDLTQAFFTTAIEKEFFQKYDPAKARFRTFLITCLNGFVANAEKASHRLKRGGSLPPFSLDFDRVEDELQGVPIPAAESLDAYFEREWTRSFFTSVIDELRCACAAHGRQVHFHLFERYYIDGADEVGRITYAQLAEQFALSPSQVTNYLALVRREFKKILLDKLRQITVSEAEFRREARALLGGEP